MLIERPVSALLQDVIRDVLDIVHSEVLLVTTEVGEVLLKAHAASVLVALGALGTIFMALFVLLTCVFALALVLPIWAATLCVAVAVGVAGVGSMSAGIRHFKAIRVTPKSIASMKENVIWAKRQIK